MASRPPVFSWQAHPCPPWCELDHHDDDHPEDRVHRGAAHHVAVTLAPGAHEVQDVLITVAERPVGSGTTISLQQAEAPLLLRLTPEGAALLHDALGHTLHAVSSGSAPGVLSPRSDPGPRSSAEGSP
ncbi:hypothetical protein ASD11_12815 [Aeromicrobium sp. Root495]|uniref:DUF6907 domain-containing protein n=1 Tax=Aeromicrobium sp. Root495 TaxID=1736550 RepID=UPI0006F5F20A|nr:hypothetical protein [Aeromicrobium sp. Root495]KQY60329.1 hypothetical protein ASD11_12815 [Aeromicrobium sp. Root495]